MYLINKEINTRVNITISKVHYEQIKQLAKLDNRSANSFIISMIHEGLRLSPKAKLLQEQLQELQEENTEK